MSWMDLCEVLPTSQHYGDPVPKQKKNQLDRNVVKVFSEVDDGDNTENNIWSSTCVLDVHSPERSGDSSRSSPCPLFRAETLWSFHVNQPCFYHLNWFQINILLLGKRVPDVQSSFFLSVWFLCFNDCVLFAVHKKTVVSCTSLE